MLKQSHYRTDAEVQQAVLTWLRDLDSDFFYAGFGTLVYRWNKCFDSHCDYMEKNPKLAFLMNGVIFISGIVVSVISNVYYNLHPTAIYVYNHPE
ncbi:hypothetical protein AVEN_48631-1 [Araneus ventricosus]|uniref:Uncharacterized protein n=1 Tax=Araneus ventricosus TaxID=182803 RepID=A0A4Y2UIB3_ARAVE|nr:hypothetical protein AVEN_48631-1 [Araneus ventricosus]